MMKHIFHCIDAHTCGNPVRLVNEGGPELRGNNMEKEIKELLKRNRPLICTEYMARTNGSKFETHLPILKKYNVGAINWGFVSGKSNTIFPWGSKEGSTEPKTWFHDIFRKDGTPFDQNEVAVIKNLTGKN